MKPKFKPKFRLKINVFLNPKSNGSGPATWLLKLRRPSSDISPLTKRRKTQVKKINLRFFLGAPCPPGPEGLPPKVDDGPPPDKR